MAFATARKAKPYKGVGMEGPLAAWYAKNTASALPEFRTLAARIAGELDAGDWILEVAPGPGYLSVELARAGLSVASLDIMELNPALDVRNKTAVLAVDLVESLFGKSTLMRKPLVFPSALIDT